MQAAKKEELATMAEKAFTLRTYAQNREKYNLKIGERLKKARLRNGYTMAYVSKKLTENGMKIAHVTLRGYETKEEASVHRYPSIPNTIALAKFYGCSMDYLCGLSDKFEVDDTDLKEIDLLDALEGDRQLKYNGISLPVELKTELAAIVDKFVAENI